MPRELTQIIELYVESLKDAYSNNTIQAYTRDLEDFRKFMLDYLGRENLNLEDLDRRAVRSYLASLHRNKKRPATIHRRMESLNNFFDFMRRHDIITVNPVKALPRPKLGKGLPPFIPEVELCNILDRLPTETNIQIREKAMMELLYGAGLRLSEMLGLKLENFESDSQVRVLGKGSKERIIPLGKHAVQALQDYLSIRSTISNITNNNIFFISIRGNPLDRSNVQKRVNKLLESISGDLSPHDLRHAFATHLMRRGAELRAIQELLGHENLTATQIYTHLCPQDLKKIYSKTHPRA